MVKHGNLSDAELRELERTLQAEILVMARELRQDLATGVAQATAVAGARRYADRNWMRAAGSA